MEKLRNKLNKLLAERAELEAGLFDRLYKSILQEAIQGRLVPQIASEGTAEDLLEEIRNEKKRLVKEGKLKAVVSITMDEEFVVHDIKVIEGEKGLFIAMPSRKASDGEYRDIAHPINSATRERIQTIILDKYQEVMAEEAENEVLMEAAE